MVGWCGGVPCQLACLFPFRGERWFDQVRLTVSVPCIGAVVCFGVPCCAVLCSAVLCCTVPRCAVLCPALPCRAVLCPAMSCLTVLWRAVFCCAVPRLAVPCFAVSRRVVPCCGILCCAVLGCAVLCCIVSCCAVLCCAVLCDGSVAPHGPALGGRGGAQTGCSALWVAGAPCRLGLCGWLVADGRGLTLCGLCGWCCGGLGVLSGLVRRAGVHGVALPMALCLGLVVSRALWRFLSLGVRRVPRDGMAWPSRLGLSNSHGQSPVSLPPCPHPSLVLLPCLLSSPAVRVLVSVWWFPQWNVAGAVPWLLGCIGGLCGALGNPLRGCTPLPACGGRWLVGVTLCGLCVVGSGLLWCVLVGMHLWVGLPLGAVPWCGSVPWGPPGEFSVVCRPVLTGCGRVGPCGSLPCGVSPLRGCVPWRLSSRHPLSSVLCPLPFPSPCVSGPLVVPCSCDVLPPVFCSGECVPVSLRLSSPPCRKLSLCPFPFQCSSGRVVVRSVGRPWPMPGAGWSATTGRGFRGCRGGGGPEPRPGGALSMPSAAWRPPERLRRGRSGSGRGFCRRCGGGGATHACPLPLPVPPAHLTQRRSSRRAGADPQAMSAGVGGWAPRLGSWSGGGGGWGRDTRIGGVGSRKRSSASGEREIRTWCGNGARGGARGGKNGGSRALGRYGSASGSG